MQWSSLKPIPAAMDRQYSGSYHCDMDDAHQDDSHFSDMGDAGEEPSSLLNTAYGRFNERSNTSLAFAAPVLVNTGIQYTPSCSSINIPPARRPRLSHMYGGTCTVLLWVTSKISKKTTRCAMCLY